MKSHDAHVLGLFLDPDDLLGVRIARRSRRAARASAPDRAARRGRWPRPAAGRACSARDQIDVDLAAAAAARAGRPRRCAPRRRRPDHLAGSGPRPARAASTATSGWRSRLFGVSTTSGSGSTVQQRRLAAQQVEELRGGRAVGDAHVDVGGELQEALRPRAGVVRPLPFVRVRQQQHQRRPQPPLAARRDEELVDHHLRAVDEVAVLRFPDHQPRRLLDVVAVLEADRPRSRSAGCCGSRTPPAPAAATAAARARAPVFGVVEHGVAMAEGAALDVLAGQPDADAVGEDRGVGQLLGARPVDRALVLGVEDLPASSRAPVRACGGS